MDEEDEQRQDAAAGDENAHPSKVRSRCFEPVSSL
jgi:hypothetical protein